MDTLVEDYNPLAPEIVDNRNLDDRFKWWEHERIVDDLETTRTQLAFGFLNLEKDFNLSSGIRNACWFNIKETWIIGRRHWDRRGAVGAHNYIPVKRTAELKTAVDTMRDLGYRIVGAEIDDRAVPLTTYSWDAKSFVLFGQEGAGLNEEEMSMCDDLVYIPGNGPIRSLNVANTAGIMAYDYSMKTGSI